MTFTMEKALFGLRVRGWRMLIGLRLAANGNYHLLGGEGRRAVRQNRPARLAAVISLWRYSGTPPTDEWFELAAQEGRMPILDWLRGQCLFPLSRAETHRLGLRAAGNGHVALAEKLFAETRADAMVTGRDASEIACSWLRAGKPDMACDVIRQYRRQMADEHLDEIILQALRLRPTTMGSEDWSGKVREEDRAHMGLIVQLLYVCERRADNYMQYCGEVEKTPIYFALESLFRRCANDRYEVRGRPTEIRTPLQAVA